MPHWMMTWYGAEQGCNTERPTQDGKMCWQELYTAQQGQIWKPSPRKEESFAAAQTGNWLAGEQLCWKNGIARWTGATSAPWRVGEMSAASAAWTAQSKDWGDTQHCSALRILCLVLGSPKDIGKLKWVQQTDTKTVREQSKARRDWWTVFSSLEKTELLHVLKAACQSFQRGDQADEVRLIIEVHGWRRGKGHKMKQEKFIFNMSKTFLPKRSVKQWTAWTLVILLRDTVQFLFLKVFKTFSKPWAIQSDHSADQALSRSLD